MSASGITPVNSGPLVIRTYLDDSPNNTYLLGKYDYPISSNRVLLTSTNGLLIESDNIELTNLTVSSLTGNNIIASTFNIQTLYGCTLIASTFTANVGSFSNMTGSSLQVPHMSVTSLMTVSTLSTPAMIFSTATGNPSSMITMSTIVVNNLLKASTMTLDHATFLTMYGQRASVNMLSTNVVSSNTMSSNVLSITSFIKSTFDCGSVYLSTNSISSLYFIGSTLRSDIITANSTIYGSTLVLAEIRYAPQQYGDLPSTVLTLNINGSTLNGSTIIGSTIFYSTMSASSITVPQTNVSTATFVTVTGSTIVVSSLTVPRVVVSTMIGNTLSYSTMATSSINVSTMFASTLQVSYGGSVSTLYASTIVGTNQSISSLTASTINVSTMFGNTVYVQQSFMSSMNTSTLFGSFLSYSSLIGSTLSTTQLYVSSAVASTTFGQFMSASTVFTSSFFATACVGSTFIISSITGGTMFVSTLMGSTCNILNGTISTLTTSSFVSNNINTFTTNMPLINNTPLYGTAATISILTTSTINSVSVGSAGNISNTFVGYGVSTMANITTGLNNTAMGYASLHATTSGSYNTSYGASTLFSNTTGSYNTAIGAKAGVFTNFTGNYNTYIGYGAVPSQSNVTNEIVIGGSNTATGTNPGNGSNSLTIGNPAITTTIIYKNLGIGTTAPGAALDVRGSYQQIGGNMFVYNSSAAYTYVWLYSDVASGCGWFLNSSTRTADGGQKTATIRNDYGNLRLQSSGGNTNAANGITILGTSGYVGFNSSSPTHALDVGGSVTVSGTTTISNIVCTQLQSNGVSIGTSFVTQWVVNPGGSIAYSTGNVGIGTSSPGLIRLFVAGSIRFTGSLTITGSITTASTVTCGSINTQGNSITTGSISTGTFTSGSLTTNNNTLTAGNVVCNSVNGGTFLVNPLTKTSWTGINRLQGGTFNTNMTTVYGDEVWQNVWTMLSVTAAASGILTRGSFNFYRPNGINNIIQGEPVILGVYLAPYSNTWIAQSDRRLKTNIQNVNSCLSSFLNLRPVTYYLNKDKTNQLQVGLIAQEVQELFPLLVSENGEKLENGEHMLSIGYTLFIPYFVKAFQEQHEIIKIQDATYVQLCEESKHLEIKSFDLQNEYDSIIDQLQKQEYEIQQLENQINALLTT